MKLGLVMEEFQDLRTHLNLRTDFTGRFARIYSTKSCGRWFWRIGGSLIEDIFQRKERERERERELIQGLCVIRIQTQSLEYGLSLFLLASRFVFVVFSENKQTVAIISYDAFVVYRAHSNDTSPIVTFSFLVS